MRSPLEKDYDSNNSNSTRINFNISSEIRKDFFETAHLLGTNGTAILKDFINQYISENKDKILEIKRILNK